MRFRRLILGPSIRRWAWIMALQSHFGKAGRMAAFRPARQTCGPRPKAARRVLAKNPLYGRRYGTFRSSDQSEYLHRTGEALQRHLADGLRHGGFRGERNAASKKNFSIVGFRTQSRGNVGDGANRRVVLPLLEADEAERRVALGDADAKAKSETPAMPNRCKSAHSRAHLDGERQSADDRVGTGNRIIKEHHQSVT